MEETQSGVYLRALKLAFMATAMTSLAIPASPQTCPSKVFYTIEDFSDWYGGITSTLGSDYPLSAYYNDVLYRNTSDGLRPGVLSNVDIDPQTQIATLSINQNCKWSDGTAITSADLKTGIEAIFSEHASKLIHVDGLITNASEVQAGKLPITALEIETPDHLTVQFPTELGLDSLKMRFTDSYITPIPHEAVENDVDFLINQSIPQKFSGPYYVSEFQAENLRIHLLANPYFCGVKPQFSEIELIAKGRLSDFLVSGIDDKNILSVTPSDTEEAIHALLSLDWVLEHYVPIHSQLAHVNFYRYNAVNGPLANKRIREAITLAIDWEGTSGIYQRSSINLRTLRPAKALIPPKYVKDIPRFQTDTRPRRHRIKDALEILRSLNYNAETPLKLKAAIVATQKHLFFPMKEMMESELPIDISVTVFENEGDYYEHVHMKSSTEFDLSIAAWGTHVPSPLFYLDFYFHNNTIPSDLMKKGEVFLERIGLSSDQEEVLKAQHDALELLYDELVFIPVAYLGEVSLVTKQAERQNRINHPVTLDLKPKSDILCAIKTHDEIKKNGSI